MRLIISNNVPMIGDKRFRMESYTNCVSTRNSLDWVFCIAVNSDNNRIREGYISDEQPKTLDDVGRARAVTPPYIVGLFVISETTSKELRKIDSRMLEYVAHVNSIDNITYMFTNYGRINGRICEVSDLRPINFQWTHYVVETCNLGCTIV